MRDGMPGPGWWIASDGRWYPPELHPDVRAPAAVAVDDPTPPSSLSSQPSLTSQPSISSQPSPSPFDVPRDVSNGATAFLGTARSSNGTEVATRPARDEVDVLRQPRRSVRQPSRSGRHRMVLGLALTAGTLALIAYLAQGHDDRPTLDSLAPTTTAVQREPATTSAPATSAATSAPSPTTSRSGTTPSTTVTTVSTVSTVAKVAPKVVSVFELVKGNCLDGESLNDGLVTTIRVVDCAEVHTHEVYYSGRYPDSTFDATKISNYANDTCLAQFAPYVGIDYTRSRYQYLHIVPTQESWTRDNDRDVVCVAFEEDATITGSIAGRAQ